MTKRLLVVVIFIVALASLPVVGQSQSGSKPTIQGVWRIVERTLKSATAVDPAGTNSNPQPGLWIVTGKHFSQPVVQGNKPRPDLPDVAKATADQLRAAWQPFAGQAGTYELAGDEITFRTMAQRWL